MTDGVTFWAWPFERDGEFGGARPLGFDQDHDPSPRLGRMRSPDAAPGAHTTLAVIAASVALIPAECKRVAMMARDGMARAIWPIHTPFDGDTVFALAHGRALPEAGLSQLGLARAAALARIGSAAADGLARPIARGVHHASSRSLNRRIL